jgi:hypothetical protein
VGAAQPRGHRGASAGHQPGSDAQPVTDAEPHAYAAAHDAFAHAVPGQPVTVPDAVRAGPLTVGGIADRKRAGISRAVGDVGPAVRPAG